MAHASYTRVLQARSGELTLISGQALARLAGCQRAGVTGAFLAFVPPERRQSFAVSPDGKSLGLVTKMETLPFYVQQGTAIVGAFDS